MNIKKIMMIVLSCLMILDYNYGIAVSTSLADSAANNITSDTTVSAAIYYKQQLPCKFTQAGAFYKGYAIVSVGSQEGIIDRQGNFLIPLGKYKYPKDMPLSEVFKYNCIIIQDHDKVGLINNKGKLLITPKYDCLWVDSSKYAVVKYGVTYNELIYGNGKYGYYATSGIVRISDGREIVKPKYRSAYINSKDTLACIEQTNGKYVIADFRGKVTATYDRVETFSKGRAGVYKNGKSGFIDDSYKLVVPFIYDQTGEYNDKGIAVVKKGTKWGAIDKRGKIVIPINYDNIQDVNNGTFIATTKGKSGLVSQSGKVLVKPQFDIAYYNSGFVMVKNKNSDYWYVYDKAGKLLFKHKGTMIPYPVNNTFIIEDKHEGVLDLHGNIIVPIEYDFIFTGGKENTLFARKDNNAKSTLFDAKGNTLVPLGDYACIYTNSGSDLAVLYSFDKDGKICNYRFYNMNNKVLLPVKCDNISLYKYGAIATNNEKYTFINALGDTLYSDYDQIQVLDTPDDAFIQQYLIIKKDNKAGLIDNTGKLIVPLGQYDDFGTVSEGVNANSGLVTVQKNGVWGFISINK